MKSAAMVVAMMALGLGLIAGLVFGVGKVRSMFVDVPVQSNSVQSNSAQSNPAQSNPAQSNPAQSGSGESVAMNTRQVESDNSNTTNQPSAIEPKPKSRPPVMPFQSSPNRPRPTFNRPNPTLPPLRDRPPTAQTPPNPITQDFPSSMGERDFRIPGSKNPDPNNVGNDASGTSSEVASPRLIAQSGPLDSPAIAMVYSNDGKLLAVSTRGHLRIFDAETLRELAFGKTDAPFGRLVSIVFDRQGRFVIAGNGRGQFRWWRLVTGDDQSLSMERLPSVLQSQRSAIAAMTINDAGNLLVTVDQSGQLMWQRISEDAEKVQSATAETDLKGIQALHFDQASMSARICGVGGSVVCDLKAKTSEAPTLWQANSSAISVDGRWMVAAIGSQLRLFATDAIDPVHQLQVPRGMMSRVVFTSDDYVVGANTSNMTIWSVASGQIIANGEIPSVPRPVMASSPNGQRIAISSTVTPEGLHILRP